MTTTAPAPPATPRSFAAVRPRHVYLHVPFCGRRCAYCDFAIAVRRQVPVDEYVDAVARELGRVAPGAWQADTVYLGGGTPSKLGGAGVARVLDVLRERIALAPGAEVTIEANPEDVTEDAVARWVDAGVNRLSLGVQTFDDRVLAWMHRGHTGADAERAYGIVRRGGIANVSVDLIFALPGEVVRDWDDDLRRALALEPAHLSLYGLTVEPRTPLGRWTERGTSTEAPEERYEADFLAAHEALAAAGFEHYEVSNFGRPGRHSRHNAAYWSGVAYAGLGPGAHEFDGRRRRWNADSYVEWVRRLRVGDDPMAGDELLTPQNRVAEAVYLGLRTSDGLVLLPDDGPGVDRWVAAGWGRVEDGRLRLTPAGWLRLDTLAAALTLVRSRS